MFQSFIKKWFESFVGVKISIYYLKLEASLHKIMMDKCRIELQKYQFVWFKQLNIYKREDSIDEIFPFVFGICIDNQILIAPFY